jgi:hypothetical protein
MIESHRKKERYVRDRESHRQGKREVKEQWEKIEGY